MEDQVQPTLSELPVRSRIVGVRSNAGPLENVSFRLGDGVTALYGRNGAGKSWCLQSLRDSLVGRAGSDTHVIIAVDPSEMDWMFPEHDEYLDRPDNTATKGERLRSWLTRRPVSRGVSDLSFDPSPALIGALDQSQHVALFPTGDSEARWDVWLCVDPWEDTELRAEVELALEIMDAVAGLRAASGAIEATVSRDELHSGADLKPESRLALEGYWDKLQHLLAIDETNELPDIWNLYLDGWDLFRANGVGGPFSQAGDLIETQELYWFWARHAVCASGQVPRSGVAGVPSLGG